MLIPVSVNAHFKLNLNIRIFHIEHHDDGLDVFMRLPMPYLVATLLGPELADGTRSPAPFTTHAMVDDELMHYLDLDALQRDPLSLGQLAADGHQIEANGEVLTAAVKEVLVYSSINQSPFSTLEEAKRSFENAQSQYDPAPFVGDSVVDVLLQYRPGRSIASYQLSGLLNPDLPGQEDTANLVLDYGGNATSVYRVTGLLSEPVVIDKSLWTAAKTFIVEGVKHILGGYDHVLFVICLVLGATTLASLAWRVTGFTFGHSITLSLGFFGYVPTGSWFVPLVETAIALSIIAVAVYALLQSDNKNSGGLSAFVFTVLLGLLHGLGFSFVLQEILGVTSSNIWISLLSFNVGVELGQLAIVLIIWPVLMLIYKYKAHWKSGVRWALALPCIAIASVWTGQRTIQLLASVM